MAQQDPEWVERYRRDVGEWPPGYGPGARLDRMGRGMMKAGAIGMAMFAAAVLLAIIGLFLWVVLAA